MTSRVRSVFLFRSCPPPSSFPPQPRSPIRPGPARTRPLPRPRPQPRAQTDRLRQEARRYGPAARRHPRLRPVRQPLRHRRPCGHPRPHHQRPASRRDAGSPALPPRRARTGPHSGAHPPAHPTRARRRAAVRRSPNLSLSTRASRACPPRRKSPRRCAAARSAPSSSISAAISASRPATSTEGSGTKSTSPSSCMAAASSASSTTGEGARPPSSSATTPVGRPRMARGAAAIAGARHRPALNAERSASD